MKDKKDDVQSKCSLDLWKRNWQFLIPWWASWFLHDLMQQVEHSHHHCAQTPAEC